jgi:hypothetical protein
MASRAICGASVAEGLDFETALRIDPEIHAMDQPAIAALVHVVAPRDLDPFTIGDVIIFGFAGPWCWLARHGNCLPTGSDSNAALQRIKRMDSIT